MEWIGFFCICLILCHSHYRERIKVLERKIKKIQNREENAQMSRIISRLTGKKCRLTASEVFTSKINADILDSDEEWVQLKITDKKGREQIKIIRIDCISEIEITE